MNLKTNRSKIFHKKYRWLTTMERIQILCDNVVNRFLAGQSRHDIAADLGIQFQKVRDVIRGHSHANYTAHKRASINKEWQRRNEMGFLD